MNGIMKLAIYSIICIALLASPLWGQQTLTLENALKIAFENNPDIRQAKLNFERAQHYLDARNAALKTQINLRLTPIGFSKYDAYRTYGIGSNGWEKTKRINSNGYLSISQPLKWTDGTLELTSRVDWLKSKYEAPWYQTNNNNEYFNNSLYLSYYQPIFTYNRIKLELKQLELELENASIYYALEKLWLERNVSYEFYNIYYYKTLVEVTKEALNLFEQSFEIIKQKLEAGSAAEEELSQTKVNLAIKQSRLRDYQIYFDQTLDRFKVLIGIPITEQIDIITDINRIDVAVDQQKAIDQGTNHRLELRQREIDIEESLFQVTRNSAINEFRGSIDLSYMLSGNEKQFVDTFEKPSKDQRISLSLVIPLFDWGLRKSYIKAAEKLVEYNRISAQDESNEIIIGIRQAYRLFENRFAQVDITFKGASEAELTFNKYFERYKNEDLSSMMLSLYLNQYSSQKLDLVWTLIQYRLALLELKIQSLWDFEKNQQVLPINEL